MPFICILYIYFFCKYTGINNVYYNEKSNSNEIIIINTNENIINVSSCGVNLEDYGGTFTVYL